MAQYLHRGRLWVLIWILFVLAGLVSVQFYTWNAAPDDLCPGKTKGNDETVCFAHLTDPHLFTQKDKDDAEENRQTLRAAVRELNKLDPGGKIDFVVITGDLEVETLVANPKTDYLPVDQRLESGARVFAEILAESNIKTWFFVPGNNDLVDELPSSISRYEAFTRRTSELLEYLESDVSVRNLVEDPHPVGPHLMVGFDNSSFKNNHKGKRARGTASIQRALTEGVTQILESTDASHAFLFFHIPETEDPYLARQRSKVLSTHRVELKGKVEIEKGQSTVTPLASEADAEKVDITGGTAKVSLEAEFDQTAEEPSADVDRSDRSCAEWIDAQPFYPLPAKDECDLSRHGTALHSSWCVTGEVLDAWERLLKQEKLRGLFAGHFHSKAKCDYKVQHGSLTPIALNLHNPPLYIAPPLAFKHQEPADLKASIVFRRDPIVAPQAEPQWSYEEPAQARGFQVVQIGVDGAIEKRTIYWYDRGAVTD